MAYARKSKARSRAKPKAKARPKVGVTRVARVAIRPRAAGGRRLIGGAADAVARTGVFATNIGVMAPYNQPRTRRVITPMSALAFHSASLNVGKPLPTPDIVGTCLTIDSVNRFSVETNASYDRFYIFQWTDSAVRVVKAQSNSQDYYLNDDTYLAHQIQQANPISIRAGRMSVKIRNSTISQSVGGLISTLVSAEPFEWVFADSSGTQLSTECLASLNSMMASHPDVRMHPAHMFKNTQEFVMPISSHTEMKTYSDYEPILLTGGAVSTDAVKSAMLARSGKKAPLCTLIVKLHVQNIAQNTYDFTHFSQDNCRFSANSWYSSLQRVPPSARPDAYLEGARASLSAGGAPLSDSQL